MMSEELCQKGYKKGSKRLILTGAAVCDMYVNGREGHEGVGERGVLLCRRIKTPKK